MEVLAVDDGVIRLVVGSALDPLERLAAIRKLFFPAPGMTLGKTTMTVQSQNALGYPENLFPIDLPPSGRYPGAA